MNKKLTKPLKRINPSTIKEFLKKIMNPRIEVQVNHKYGYVTGRLYLRNDKYEIIGNEQFTYFSLNDILKIKDNTSIDDTNLILSEIILK